MIVVRTDISVQSLSSSRQRSWSQLSISSSTSMLALTEQATLASQIASVVMGSGWRRGIARLSKALWDSKDQVQPNLSPSCEGVNCKYGICTNR